MNQRKLIKELLAIEAWAEGTRIQSAKLRKQLEGAKQHPKLQGKAERLARTIVDRNGRIDRIS